ncbi:restriction endonuclease [Aliikangiella coralliicola]|uniref:Restriction endonuclease n=1 Tax=Aliikangiella coralliicola TaxID=2592383 RepID=A0A545UDY6_9GAMM|nr:restriction endonuclease [Aliikangiella coralliicola]TQV87671.1 restriction endonuclease [Aliikangiella coralliicola]
MDLSSLDLVVDRIYKGSRNGNTSDDPLPSLLGVDNGAGFRHLGKRPDIETLKLLVLKSTFKDPDWPDKLNTESGLFTYYGDNKSIREIHDTPRQGNLILRNLFEARHQTRSLEHFPPILLFGGTGEYWDVRFLGLAVPGAQRLGPDDDLTAIWRSTGAENLRFQNYRAIFTVLDVPVVKRKWIDDIKNGNAANSKYAPTVWLDWVKNRKYSPLYSPHTIEIRNKEQQLPKDIQGLKILSLVYEKYKDDPIGFEACAVEIARLTMPDIGDCEITRPWRDGGRDAIGYYRIGTGPGSIEVEFALEAKCYKSNSGVGVKELSRLLSRLRHRQFGILVTTSYVSSQAYRELKEDGHPVVLITAIDIVNILIKKIGSAESICRWLDRIGIATD